MSTSELRETLGSTDIPGELRAELLAAVDWHEAREKRKYGIQEPTPGTAMLIMPTCANVQWVKPQCSVCGALVPIQQMWEPPFYIYPELCVCGRRLFLDSERP